MMLFTLAFEDQDHEIFDLQDALTKIYPESDFYSVLQVKHSASSKEITKAFRKVSLQFHPDKNATKEAAELYKLLTSINEILRDPQSR